MGNGRAGMGRNGKGRRWVRKGSVRGRKDGFKEERKAAEGWGMGEKE